jgi:micrococcal nuclease
MARRRRRRSGGLNPLVAAGLLLITAVFGTRALGSDDSPDAPAGSDNATVLRVVDGDTVVVQVGGSEETIRLIGIDTPESVARDEPVECYGPEASDRLGQLLPRGTAVRLERDVEPRDRYGRLLAYVHRVQDNLFVNHDQVARGFAEASEYPPNTAYSADLSAAQRQAQSTGAGLWTAC